MKTSLSIRARVGLLLSILVAVIVYMSVSRIIYLRDKEHEFLSVTQASRVSFERVNELRLTSFRLRDIAEDIFEETEESNLGSAETSARSILEGAGHFTLSEAAPQGSTSAEEALDLAGLQGRLAEAITARRAYLQAVADLADQQQTLTTTLDLLQAQLNRLNVSFRRAGGYDTLSGVSLDHVEAGLLLRVKLASLLDRGRYLATTTEPATVRPKISELVPDLRDVLRALSEVGDIPEKQMILQQVAALRKDIDAESGLQAISDRVLKALVESDAAYENFATELKAVDAALGDMVARTEASIYRVFDETALASRRAILNEILLSWGAALGLVFAVWLVFHRQISRRIELLSYDVRRIASGHVDTQVSVGGGDEIGKMAEALEVFRRNARALQSSNEQLRNFTYVASHDLRSPLRAIRDLVEWTIEDAGDDLPEDVLRNLAMIRGRCERLSQLLSDLLTYARADHSETVPKDVDLLALTRSVADFADPSKGFVVSYRGTRRVKTFASPLQTILLNLVSNAIKHHDRSSGTISVAGKVEGNCLVLDVQDDGPGIDVSYQERIFEMFQTLGGDGATEGSGMGLALVRKLAHALEGKISIASNPKERRGTTFTLRIPVQVITDSQGTEDSTFSMGDAA